MYIALGNLRPLGNLRCDVPHTVLFGKTSCTKGICGVRRGTMQCLPHMDGMQTAINMHTGAAQALSVVAAALQCIACAAR